MDKPWTLVDCQIYEDQAHDVAQTLYEALEDTEYFDWLDNGDAAAFPPPTAAMIERALKDAHLERKRAALAALRVLLRINSDAIEEVRCLLEEE